MLTPQSIQSTWVSEFPVSSFLVDSGKNLSLHGLIALMQETAWTHAFHLGHGYTRTRADGGSWVIARQKLQLERWPQWEEHLTIKTWLRPPGAVIVTRDFEFSVDGEEIGTAAAHWLTISHATRRPTKLPFPDNPLLFRQHGHLNMEPEKLKISGSLSRAAQFTVRYTDLDMNGHVNNTRFAQWVLDALPLDSHARHRVRGYQINFLAEARPGETLTIFGSQTPGLGQHQTLLFQGRRSEDDKVLFNVELRFACCEKRTFGHSSWQRGQPI